MKTIIPNNYNENAYAHAMVGAYLWNDLYDTYIEKTKRLVERAVKRGQVPEQISVAKSVLAGRLVRMAHRHANNVYDEHWKLEKGDTWCARLWIADDIIERVEYALKNGEQ